MATIKIQQKEELEEIKRKRIEERKKKKVEKEREKEAKLRAKRAKATKKALRFDDFLDSESADSCESQDERTITPQRAHLKKEVGEFVAVSYDKKVYPGIISHISDSGATISAMIKCGRQTVEVARKAGRN